MSEKNEQQPLQHYSRPQMSRRQDPNLRGHHADSQKHEKGGKHTSLWVSLIIIAILIISIGPLISSQVNHNSRQDLASPKVVKKSSKKSAKTSSANKKAKTKTSSTTTKAKTTQTQSKQTTTSSAAKTNTTTGQTSTANTAQSQSQTSSQKTMPSTYTVKSGDSLSNIASQYGLTVEKLTQLNNLSSADSIQPGQTLKLK
ncbi:MAG: LysM peptidoglycan-binding domain-containing protein [Lactobacillus sp.]|jgi:LysM repeat protein|nr:LysM peptidoglycan-binding domain-containing protein [Lactobacillus sp.]